MSHVVWPNLLPLTLRLHASEAILGTGYPLEAFESDEFARPVLETLLDVARGEIGAIGREQRSDEDVEAEGPAIDAYFARVGSNLSHKTAQLAGKSKLADVLLGAFGEVLNRKVCQECCRRPEPQGALAPCRWTKLSEAADRSAMAERGFCLNYIRTAFDFALEATAKAYEDACGEPLQTKVVLKTSLTMDRNAELELAANAWTTEDEDDLLHKRFVTVSFHVESTWMDDLLALPYLALHECLAHGYCGVNIQDSEAERSKPFHEGWMDCVASYVLQQSLQSGSGRFSSIGDAILRQTAVVRGLRFNRAERPARPRDVWHWIQGEQALHTFERLFVRALTRSKRFGAMAVEGIAREQVVAFSLAINASDVSHAERARFCIAVNSKYTRIGLESTKAAVEERPQVIDFIDEFLATFDSRKLFAKVIAIR